MNASVHGFACELTAGNRIDRKPCAVVYITACEDIFFCGLEGNRICLDRAISVDFNSGSLEEVAHDDGLTDGQQDVVTAELDRFVLVILRVEASFAVLDAGALLEDDTGDLAVLGEDLLRTPAVHDFDAFCLCVFDFIVCRRHFILAFKAQHCDLAIRNTLCGTGNVDCDITAADDNDITFKAYGVIEVDAAQEFDTGLDVLGVFARNTGHTAALHTDRNVECLVALMTQILDRDIASDIHTALEFHTHLTQDIDFRIDDFLLKTEVRNTIQ